MSKDKMSKDELRWQSESDVRTLEEYNQIIGDKSRLERALAASKEKIKDLSERASALGKSITGLKKSK